MKKRVLLVVLAVLLTAIIVIAVQMEASSHSQASSYNSAVPTPQGVVNHGGQPAGHAHAITPRAALVQAHKLPTFTVADVEAYLQTDAVAIEASSKHLPHTIAFVSASELGQRLNDDFSQDASILCYVQFTGTQPFTLNAVRMPPGMTPSKFTKVFEVFDGITGDLLTWGAMK